jgi:hypothetical protein
MSYRAQRASHGERDMGASGVPKTLNQREAIKLMVAHGWSQETGGKHNVKMVKDGEPCFALPSNHRRDYPRGLRDAILLAAGITGTPTEDQV